MPYYRFYFGSNPASGFFIEGFGMLNSYSEKRQVYSNTLVNTVVNTPTQTDLAIGFGLGGKFVTKNPFLFILLLLNGLKLISIHFELPPDLSGGIL